MRDPSYGAVDNPLNWAFNPSHINQVWAADINYLHAFEGWLYLAIVMDLYSRRIIGWALSARITTDVVLQVLHNALVYDSRLLKHGCCFIPIGDRNTLACAFNKHLLYTASSLYGR